MKRGELKGKGAIMRVSRKFNINLEGENKWGEKVRPWAIGKRRSATKEAHPKGYERGSYKSEGGCN